MPELLDHVAYLSQDIGPRPAGTEEEQQAALYITEQIQKEAGLSAVIEDFGGAQSSDAARVICCVCALVISAAALFLPVLGVASIVVTAVTAILFALEAFDKPVLSRAFSRGVSQNVVAKYEPGFSAETGGTRRRKVILVARYDSGKVRSELSNPLLKVLPAAQWATLGGMVLLPILLVIRNVLFLNAEGTVAIVLNALVVIALIPVALLLIVALLHKIAAYNEAANCNASGVAVLLEVARRVGRGRVSADELAAQTANIHGEEAARSEGLVPEGAQLVYEAANMKPPELAPQTPEERLAAAKAAVAALSGKPVSSTYTSDLSQNLVQVKEPPLAPPTDEAYREQLGETREALTTIPPDTVQAALQNAEATVQPDEGGEGAEPATASAWPVPTPAPSGAVSNAASDGVPEWFKKAQEKAKKPRTDNTPVQRSRYASALDAAVSESAGHFASANEIVEQKLEQSLGAGQDEIREVKAPQAPQWTSRDNSASQATAAIDTSSIQEGMAQQDPSSTTAMPPIDVNALNLDELPTSDMPLPSFLDPRKVQEESRALLQDEEPRTDRRVDVTGVPIDASGRIYPQTQNEVPGQTSPVNVQSAKRRPIELPDIGVGAASPAPIGELPKQRAPLAEAAEDSGKSAAKSLLTMLPSISVDTPDAAADPAKGAADQGEATGDRVAKKAALRTMLPSLSGAIRRSDNADGPSNVSAAGSFAPAGATGAFAPVGDELLENVDPDDIYVDDADDSAYEEHITETGAFAGPGYVDMPRSRAHRLFDRFRRKKKVEDEPTPQEWLEVDETFDARTVGAERGGWESFRSEDEGFEEDSFSSADDSSEFDFDEKSGRRWHGGAFSLRRAVQVEENGEDGFEDIDVAQDDGLKEEIQSIYQFHNPDINTEVWFVALGSELTKNAGMQAFLNEHQQDLRGSIVVEIEGLGAGDLCMVEREGKYRSMKASSRMARYVKKASQATGLNVGTAEMCWEDSASTAAMRRGFQALHLVGMDGDKPAFYAQANDMMENIDDETLHRNADFVMELLKNI